jgi:hypothetical protein
MRDPDVRSAVLARLNEVHANDANTRIVEEMGVWSGSVRVDIAVINGELTGVELKSDRDTLRRLSLQVDLYSRVFDRMELVVGERHMAAALSRVPTWWEITIATMAQGGVALELFRAGQRNSNPDAYLVAQLLWKDEAICLLEKFDLAKGWRSKRVKAIHQRLADELPYATLAESVRLALKRREFWLGKRGAHQLNVTVDTNLNPSFQIARSLLPRRDAVDSLIRPTKV